MCTHGVNMLVAGTLTKWNKACRQNIGTIDTLYQPHENYRQNCLVGDTIEDCKLGLFQDASLARDLHGSKSTSGVVVCVFRLQAFVPSSWMCKKQTAVSFSSAESEIHSFNAGLRMEGIPA